MPIRLKKLIGTVLLIVLVIVYALVATTVVAVAQLAESGPLVHLAFFLFSGIAVDPAGHGHHQMDDASQKQT